MRFPRYLLALGALFFFAVVVSAEVDVEESPNDVEADDDDVESRNPLLLRAAIFVLKKALQHAAKHCLKEAANNCKQHWKNPKELVNCGRAFFERNKGRCATG